MIDELWIFGYIVFPLVIAAAGYLGVSLFLAHKGPVATARPPDEASAPVAAASSSKKKRSVEAGAANEPDAPRIVRHAAE